MDKQKKKKKEKFPHFRWYRKSKHPALIVGEKTNEKKEEEFNFHKVTHRDKEGRHSNVKLEPNPNPKDNKPMYVVKRVRHDKKKYFGEKLPWEYLKKKRKK